MNEPWVQIFSLFIANAGLIAWFRSESRADWRHMDNKLDASIREIREDSKTFQKAVLDEMKDFHDRLCAIEEKRRYRK